MQAFVYITADFTTAQNAVNEVVIWSRIVQQKRNARIKEAIRLEYPYALTDPGEQSLLLMAVICPASKYTPRHMWMLPLTLAIHVPGWRSRPGCAGHSSAI